MIPNLSWKFFWHWQRIRLEFRALMLWRAFVVALFWTVVLGALARFAGPGSTALWIVLGVWAVVAWPTIVFDLIIFADLINYLVTGRAYLMRTFDEIRKQRTQTHSEWLEQMHRDSPSLYLYTRLAKLASHTSPLGPLAMWCALVIKRLPEEAYVTEERPAAVLRLPKRAADIEGMILEGFVYGRHRAATM